MAIQRRRRVSLAGGDVRVDCAEKRLGLGRHFDAEQVALRLQASRYLREEMGGGWGRGEWLGGRSRNPLGRQAG